MKPLLALSCCLALASLAPAQTVQRQVQVWRCGPDGRDLRDSPCPAAAGASAHTVPFDEPSAADRSAAHARHLADGRQAAALAAARRASEAEARHQRAGRVGAPPPPVATPPAASAPLQRPNPPKLARPRKPVPPTAGASGAGR